MPTEDEIEACTETVREIAVSWGVPSWYITDERCSEMATAILKRAEKVREEE